MKTFKSAEALQRAALQRGVSATVGGRVFNTAGDRVAVDRPTKAPAKAEEPVAPEPIVVKIPELVSARHEPIDLAPIVQGAVDAMASSVSEIARDNAKVMEEVVKAVQKITEIPAHMIAAPAAVEPASKHWRLTVNRNLRGFMETVDIKKVA